MRRHAPRLIAIAASLLLAAPTGSAHAAKAHPWAAFHPAQGVTCTSAVVYADGTTETLRTTVVAKSAKEIVTRSPGQGRATTVLLPRGRAQATTTISERIGGIRARATAVANFPSPNGLRKQRAGTGTVTLRMTLPQAMAETVLRSGRTLTIIGNYRLVGLGMQSITLADPAATTVEAVGIRTKLRSMTIRNATADFQRSIKRAMRMTLVSMGGTEWVAPGRGMVRATWTDEDGSKVTTTQIGCS